MGQRRLLVSMLEGQYKLGGALGLMWESDCDYECGGDDRQSDCAPALQLDC